MRHWSVWIAFAFGGIVATLHFGKSLAAQDDSGVRAPMAAYNEIRTLVIQGALDEAIAKTDSFAKETPSSPFLSSIRMNLAASLLKANRPEEAATQVQQQLAQFERDLEDGKSVPFGPLVKSLAGIMNTAGKLEVIETWLNKLDKEVSQKLVPGEFNSARIVKASLIDTRAHLLSLQGQESKGLELLRGEAAEAEKVYQAKKDAEGAAAYAITAASNLLMKSSAKEQMEIFDRVDALAQSHLQTTEDLTVLNAFAQSSLGFVSSASRDHPLLADEALQRASATLNRCREWMPKYEKNIDSIAKSLNGMKSRIESGKKIAEMIGKPAPRLDAMRWVNGEERDPASLLGKVVLMDFWAVWCAPCIATFPHLKHLHEEYSSKGLQIVGITRQYNYAWDEESGKAKRSEEKVSLEDELIMLEKFIASHELKHPTVVTPEGSRMNQEFGVTGIPHVALLDKKGMIRLVKIGSGEENAKAIEAMIQTLLEE